MRKCTSPKKQHVQKSKIPNLGKREKQGDNIGTFKTNFKKSKSKKIKRQRIIQPVMHFSLATEEQKQKHYQKYNCDQTDTPSENFDSNSSYTVYEYEEEEDIGQDDELTELKLPPFSTIDNLSTSIEYEQRFLLYYEIQRIEQTRKRIYLSIFFNLWKSRYQNPQDILVDPASQRRLNVPLAMVEKYSYATIDSNYECDQHFCDDLNLFRRMRMITKKSSMNNI